MICTSIIYQKNLPISVYFRQYLVSNLLLLCEIRRFIDLRENWNLNANKRMYKFVEDRKNVRLNRIGSKHSIRIVNNPGTHCAGRLGKDLFRRYYIGKIWINQKSGTRLKNITFWFSYLSCFAPKEMYHFWTCNNRLSQSLHIFRYLRNGKLYE